MEYLIVEFLDKSKLEYYFDNEKDAITHFCVHSNNPKKIYKLQELELEQKLVEKEV